VARLTLTNLSKDFGTTRAVDDVSMTVEDGEFLAILGPSGCGKTTLLRLVAGFETASRGEIAVGSSLLSGPGRHVPPEHRRMGIVFQSYALWPHMSVAGNVAYALKVRGTPAAERDRRVAAALATVGLSGFADRRPASLSGGQRQRVALARCLAMEPSVVLLDEPLSNLDAHLRAAMHAEFAAFHERARTTMIYITHDQAEAMALADRIAVMDRGRLLQVAPPSLLYREPANATVARFVGEGLVLPARALDRREAGLCAVELLGEIAPMRCAPAETGGRAADICLRPGGLAIAREGLPARIVSLSYRGGAFRAEAVPDAAPNLRLPLDLPEPAAVSVGDAVRLAIRDGWILPQAA
jgi:iron(III) transport system ATP-binding protein